MLQNTIPEIQSIIESSSNLVILFISDICVTNLDNYKKIQEMVENCGHPVSLYHICFDDDGMPFPRVQPDVLYYFAPKNQIPLFWRDKSQSLLDTQHDIETAIKMINGVSYVDAKFDAKTKKKYLQTNKYLEKESLSKYSEEFRDNRLLAKQMWKIRRNNAKSLPFLCSAEEAHKRLEICKRCNKFDKKERMCKECGCGMLLKVHTKDSECPLNKWPKLK